MLFGDQYHDPEKGGSTRFEADLAPFKPRADVVLVGQAHAPLGRPVQRLEATLRIATLQRSIALFGDRYWRTDGSVPTLSSPQPFTVMPIVYERAFGGIDTAAGGVSAANPVGRGFLLKPPGPGRQTALPNIEHPDQLIQWWQDQPQPAGFGFYSKSWQPRVGLLGTYDERWREQRAPGPPADFRSGFFNGAHPSLQLDGYLRGDETIELINLSSEGRQRWQLPGLQVGARIQYRDAATAGDPLALRLDTLCLLPEQRRFYLVWRGHCALRDLTAAEIARLEFVAHRRT